MTKLNEGETYKMTFPNGHSVDMVYCGKFKQSWYHCHFCHIQRSVCYQFTVGLPDNPSQVYNFGTECIKRVSIEAVSND